MKQYTVIYEKGESSWGAFVPDLPGCICVGDTLEEVKTNIVEAIELYVEVLAEKGESIPEATYQVGTVNVA